MKKLILLATFLLSSVVVFCQSYFSGSYEVMEYRTGRVLKQGVCSVNVLIDTAGKAVTTTNLENGKITVIYLLEKSFITLVSENFRTWGYIRVMATGGIISLSFTEWVATGKLLSVNVYNDSTVVAFYIKKDSEL